VLVPGHAYGKTHEQFFYPRSKATATGLTHVAHLVLPGSFNGLFKLGATWAHSSTSFTSNYQRLLSELVTSRTATTVKIHFVIFCLVKQVNFLLTGSFRSFQALDYIIKKN